MKLCKTSKTWFLLFCFLILASTAYANTITVGPGGPADGYDYATIQAGIDAAVNGDTVILAAATYTGAGNRDLDFKGKVITVQSIDPNDPCIVATTIIDCNGTISDNHRGFYFHSGEDNNSVVSGLTITNGYVYDANGGAIYCSASSPTIRDCSIINNTVRSRDGDAAKPDAGQARGGAIFCTSGSSPEIIGCTIKNNSSLGGYGNCHGWPGAGDDGLSGYGYGGAISCTSDSNPIVSACVISNNRAVGQVSNNGLLYKIPGGNGYGGAISCEYNSNPIITGCKITDNRAIGGKGSDGSLSIYTSDGGDAYGGAIYYDYFSNPRITNCRIAENTAYGGKGGGEYWRPGEDGGDAYGGGICASGGEESIKNCALIDNTALGGDGGNSDEDVDGYGGNGYGGGVYLGNEKSSTIENCTSANNSAVGGTGAVFKLDGLGYGGGVYCSELTEIVNSILYLNSADSGPQIAGSPIVSYSDIQGGYSGTGNISVNPLFTTGPDGDYYLCQFAAGQASNSPCVDAGSDTAANLGMDVYTTRTDQEIDTGTIDMGYHYQFNPADIDDDGDVDFMDYAILANQWQLPAGLPSADIAPPGGDGIVNEDDLAFLIKYWLWEK